MTQISDSNYGRFFFCFLEGMPMCPTEKKNHGGREPDNTFPGPGSISRLGTYASWRGKEGKKGEKTDAANPAFLYPLAFLVKHVIVLT